MASWLLTSGAPSPATRGPLLFAQTIDVKGLTDVQLDETISYLEGPVVKVKGRTGRSPLQETAA
jgi:hypothetical protein